MIKFDLCDVGPMSGNQLVNGSGDGAVGDNQDMF